MAAFSKECSHFLVSEQSLPVFNRFNGRCRMVFCDIYRCEPGTVVCPGHQHQFTEGLQSHADSHVVFGLVAEFRNDEPLVVGFPGATVGYEKEVRFGTGQELCDPGKAFAVGTGSSDAGQLFR